MQYVVFMYSAPSFVLKSFKTTRLISSKIVHLWRTVCTLLTEPEFVFAHKKIPVDLFLNGTKVRDVCYVPPGVLVYIEYRH